MSTVSARRFVVCVLNKGYAASLEVRKLYEVIPDADAESHRHLRVVDESGEDYLFPQEYFRAIELPPDVVAELRAPA